MLKEVRDVSLGVCTMHCMAIHNSWRLEKKCKHVGVMFEVSKRPNLIKILYAKDERKKTQMTVFLNVVMSSLSLIDISRFVTSNDASGKFK